MKIRSMQTKQKKLSPTDRNNPADRTKSVGLFLSVGKFSFVAKPVIVVLFITTFSFSQDRPVESSATMSDSAFLDLVQRTAFDFFWVEANSSNGLIKDRSASGAPCSIASVGFGLTAICIAIDHNWITRQAGRDRVLTALKTFWEKPQGRDAQGYIGYKGFFYHFLDMNTALRTWTSELSSIDSALLLAGILYAKQYFTESDSLEGKIRALSDSIYYRVDWAWMRNFMPGLAMEWTPERGFRGAWSGYNEAMIMNILGLGSPTHPAPASIWTFWISTYTWGTQYGYSYVNFPPLFGHQYSHCWIDFRDIQDDYMKRKGIDYFENSRRATLAARAYAIANPGGFAGYGENVWGITACDGPNGYRARGAPPAQDDDGTIAPTAAGGSMAFTPEESIAALRYMYNTYKNQIWMKYGFRDAFNLTQNWWGPDVIGIDEGPIIVMIENFRSGRVWDLFMQNPDIQRGLEKAGFKIITDVEIQPPSTPAGYRLFQNYPNPFNPTTTIRFSLQKREHVTLKVFNVLGQEVAALISGPMNAGEHKIVFDSRTLPSGVYIYQLEASSFIARKEMIVIK